MGRFFGSGSVGSGAGVSFPSGSIIMFGGTGATPPAGWLLCDGASLLRASFVALFNAIGILYGSVDGTHFNIPKFDDNRKARGAVNDAGRGTTGGANAVTLAIADIPSHDHERGPAGLSLANNFDPTGGVHPSNPVVTGTTLQINRAPVFTEVEGGGGSHENQSLFVDVNYLIHV